MAGNFTIFVPHITQESQYVVSGPDCQILTINVPAGRTVYAEPGSMLFMHPSIKQEIECGKCSRWCAGESCFKVAFTNTSNQPSYLGLTPSFPSKVIPIEMNTVGNSMILKAGAYISAIDDVSIAADFDCCTFASCFAGLGCLRQGATGNGTLFVEGGGTVVTRVLGAGEQIVVSSDSIVGWQKSVELGFRPTGGIGGICFGGEGCCYTTLTGPGLVVFESMSFRKFVRAVAPKGGGGGGEGGDAGN